VEAFTVTDKPLLLDHLDAFSPGRRPISPPSQMTI
jgi:hypothetical protein